MFVRLPMIPLNEHEVIYFYRRGRWLSRALNKVENENKIRNNVKFPKFLHL